MLRKAMIITVLALLAAGLLFQTGFREAPGGAKEVAGTLNRPYVPGYYHRPQAYSRPYVPRQLYGVYPAIPSVRLGGGGGRVGGGGRIYGSSGYHGGHHGHGHRGGGHHGHH